MKKMLVLLAAIVLASTTAPAQTAIEPAAPSAGYPTGRGQGRGSSTPEQRAQRLTQHLTRELTLSAEQAPRVQGILLAQSQEHEAIRTKYAASADRRAAMPELKAIKEKYDAQLQAVLTPEQQTKYAQLRDAQQQKHKEKMKGTRPRLKTQS